MSTEFLLTTLIIVATPGTGVLYTLGAALSRGALASLIAALGCTLGIVPHVVAAITGVAALLHTSAVAFQTLKYLGVAYLIYMAWSIWRGAGALQIREVEPRSAGGIVLSGILINLLNPKLTIFFFAFLPQFVSADGSGVASMIGLSGVFMAVTFSVFAVYGVIAAQARRQVLSRPGVLRWMQRTFGLGFLGLSLHLATAER